jgi:protein-disulfide isomerase
MRVAIPFAFAIALVAVTGTNWDTGEAAMRASAKHVTATKASDWTHVVSPTPAGGFLMGNPKAKVKLVEFGSMTCPHCREFDEVAVPQLLSKYVKTGDLSWEFRNYVRDAFDVTASLIARCDGASRFFPLTSGLYAEQEKWIAKIQQTPQEKLQPIHDLPPSQQFVALAKVAGFQDWAAAHGLPVAKSTQCLSNEKSVNELVQIASDATKQFPDFKGTPAFVINGTMVDFGSITASEVWPTLESKIRSTLSAGR